MTKRKGFTVYVPIAGKAVVTLPAENGDAALDDVLEKIANGEVVNVFWDVDKDTDKTPTIKEIKL